MGDNDQAVDDGKKGPASSHLSGIQTDGRIVRYGTIHIPGPGRWSMGQAHPDSRFSYVSAKESIELVLEASKKAFPGTIEKL